MKHVFVICYAHVFEGYTQGNNSNSYAGVKCNFGSYMLSAQDVSEKFSLLQEYNKQWNRLSGFLQCQI